MAKKKDFNSLFQRLGWYLTFCKKIGKKRKTCKVWFELREKKKVPTYNLSLDQIQRIIAYFYEKEGFIVEKNEFTLRMKRLRTRSRRKMYVCECSVSVFPLPYSDKGVRGWTISNEIHEPAF